MNTRVLIGACLAVLTVVAGCSRVETIKIPDDSDRLYNGTLELVREFSDSIALAPDSTAAEKAFVRFNNLLDTLNFSVAPNTDLLLTEAENDTLYNELTALRRQYQEKLKELDDKRIDRDDAGGLAGGEGEIPGPGQDGTPAL